MNIDPEDLYLAGSIFGLEPFLMEEYDNSKWKARWEKLLITMWLISSGKYRYSAAILIPKNSEITSLADLKGKNSCHTGYGRNAGWYMPIGVLINQRIMQRDCRGLLHTAENFFHRSCVPGRWSKDPLVDMHLSTYHLSRNSWSGRDPEKLLDGKRNQIFCGEGFAIRSARTKALIGHIAQETSSRSRKCRSFIPGMLCS